jgi:hypothetical protein
MMIPIEEHVDWDGTELSWEMPGTSFHNSNVRFIVSLTTFTFFFIYTKIISVWNWQLSESKHSLIYCQQFNLIFYLRTAISSD